ncbi:MAG: glycoside hydrolase family 5 protein [bacterium]
MNRIVINRIIKYFSLIAIPALSFTACKDNPVESIPEPPPDIVAQNKLLGRGVNFGNALEAPKEGDWGVTIEDKYFSLLANTGFNSVRIPIRWSSHTSSSSPYNIQQTFFDRIDYLINKAFQNNLAVIINIHHYEEIMTDPITHKARFLAIWKQIANRYKDYSYKLFFEILNEPNSELTPQIWNEFLRDALTVIRETNPHRSVLIGLANWGGLGTLNQLVIPETEKNIILTFHYYNPFEFTHQGADWVDGSDAWLGTKWPETLTDKTRLENEIMTAVTWGAQKNIPVNCGEFGAFEKADMTSRVNWTSFVRETCEKYEISWNYWEFCSGFGIYNRDEGEFIEPLLNALIPPSSQNVILAEN